MADEKNSSVELSSDTEGWIPALGTTDRLGYDVWITTIDAIKATKVETVFVCLDEILMKIDSIAFTITDNVSAEGRGFFKGVCHALTLVSGLSRVVAEKEKVIYFRAIRAVCRVLICAVGVGKISDQHIKSLLPEQIIARVPYYPQKLSSAESLRISICLMGNEGAEYVFGKDMQRITTGMVLCPLGDAMRIGSKFLVQTLVEKAKWKLLATACVYMGKDSMISEDMWQWYKFCQRRLSLEPKKQEAHVILSQFFPPIVLVDKIIEYFEEPELEEGQKATPRQCIVM